ncbi:MAG: cobalt ECF transporter T component CbiQ [Heliobacteriaceae bacterium]|nr:cobalt ECF transporter T component CbiQ [Heliobacteriaceae bacterium]MDD4588545.1 cobalt ECF transporter T component CbiQ [Heliobacteriaceae bacterium]
MKELFFADNKPVSVFHRLDPRGKIIGIFAFVVLVATLESPPALVLSLGLVLGLNLAAKIPATYLCRRLAWLVPFAGFLVVVFPFITPGQPVFTLTLPFAVLTASDAGLHKAVVLLLRMTNALTALVFLTTATSFPQLLHGFQALKVPPLLLQLVEFTVRYLFIIQQELRRMLLARRARGFTAGRNFLHRHTLETLGQLVGVLFIRAYERSDRIHQAMLARGYPGEPRPERLSRWQKADLCWSVAVITVAVGLKLADTGGDLWLMLWK